MEGVGGERNHAMLGKQVNYTVSAQQSVRVASDTQRPAINVGDMQPLATSDVSQPYGLMERVMTNKVVYKSWLDGLARREKGVPPESWFGQERPWRSSKKIGGHHHNLGEG